MEGAVHGMTQHDPGCATSAISHSCVVVQGGKASPELSPVEQLLGMRQGGRDTGNAVRINSGGAADMAPQGGPPGSAAKAQEPASDGQRQQQQAAAAYPAGSGAQPMSAEGGGAGTS